MKVAILGGTGSFGTALARRLVSLGQDEIVIGSRDAERARTCAAELGCSHGDTNENVAGAADLAVLAVKAEGALDTAREVAGALGATPLLTVASALTFTKRGVLPDADARSLAERIQEVVSGPVVAGLHSIAAANLDEAPPGEDALICGDDRDAKELVLQLVDRLVDGRAIDAGPLAGARTLEGLTAVIVNVNKHYKVHAGVRLTGFGAA